MSFYQKYLEQVRKDFPQTAREFDLEKLIHPNLISAQTVSLAQADVDAVAKAVSTIYGQKIDPRYCEPILESDEIFEDGVPENDSALMSYDFHFTAAGPRLIEVNTNASSSLIVNTSFRAHGLQNPFSSKEFFAEIIEVFKTEFEKTREHWPKRELKRIAIVDDDPTAQRLYIEFLMYRELFEKAGFECRVIDAKDLSIRGDRLAGPDGFEIDLVYNRSTDFYFTQPVSHALRETYVKHLACITPQPFDYACFADKARLFEWSQAGLSPVLLKTLDLTTELDRDEIWTQRKKLFFKPKRAYGGKAAYRGDGMTQKIYQNVLAGDYVAQEYAEPPVFKAHLEDGSDFDFKYDLRFYVYRDKIQLAAARLWRGQMTNIHTPGGGITPVQILVGATKS